MDGEGAWQAGRRTGLGRRVRCWHNAAQLCVRAELEQCNFSHNISVLGRTDRHLALFKRAGLKVQRFQLQAGFPAELHAVRMYLLVPA